MIYLYIKNTVNKLVKKSGSTGLVFLLGIAIVRIVKRQILAGLNVPVF